MIPTHSQPPQSISPLTATPAVFPSPKSRLLLYLAGGIALLIITAIISLKVIPQFLKRKISPPNIQNQSTDQLSSETTACSEIARVGDRYYSLCKGSQNQDTLIGNGASSFDFIATFRVSQDQKRVFVVTLTENYVKQCWNQGCGGGLPTVDLWMVNLETGEIKTLGSNWNEPEVFDNFNNQLQKIHGELLEPTSVWSPDNLGIVLTDDNESVYYCSNSCLVVANDAVNYIGFGGDPAFFSGKNIFYTDINFKSKSINFTK